MERLKRRWASITLLSIVIPVSLLVSFRLTGILQEPLTPTLVQAETVSWNWSRPMANTTVKWINVSDKLTNIYDIDLAFVKLEVFVHRYYESNFEWPFEGNDGLWLISSFSANISNGYVYSVVIRFSNIDDYAYLNIRDDPDDVHLRNMSNNNLKLRNIVDWRPESYFEALGINQPNQCNAEIHSQWIFLDENNVNHQMMVDLEITYFNGTAYQQVVLPISLEVLQT